MSLTPEQARSRANATLRRQYAAVDEWDRAVIIQAIDEIGRDGRLFSMNDVRDVLPEIRHKDAGLVLHSLVHRAASPLERVGYEPSTSAATKGKPINIYRLRSSGRSANEKAAA